MRNPKNKLTLNQVNEKLKGTYLTAIEFYSPYIDRRGWEVRRCLCRCICGNTRIVRISDITAKRVNSCGCLKSNKKYTINNKEIYGCWRDMINRCYNTLIKSYKNYGERGVRVCDEWRNNYQSFLNWALTNGWQKGLQLDKDIKGDGLLYSPETCQFVNRKTNMQRLINSRKAIYHGKEIYLKEICNQLGMNKKEYKRVLSRIDSGWSIEKSIEIKGPVKKSNQRRL